MLAIVARIIIIMLDSMMIRMLALKCGSDDYKNMSAFTLFL